MSIPSDIKDMLTRKTIGINKEFTYIIPFPDTINFYDTNFNNVDAQKEEGEKEDKPYFICKYFNPDRFNVDGEREIIEEPDDDRLKNWKEAGKVIIDKYVTSHDAGNILHPEMANGQIYGGFAQAVGAALFEEFKYSLMIIFIEIFGLYINSYVAAFKIV